MPDSGFSTTPNADDGDRLAVALAGRSNDTIRVVSRRSRWRIRESSASATGRAASCCHGSRSRSTLPPLTMTPTASRDVERALEQARERHRRRRLDDDPHPLPGHAHRARRSPPRSPCRCRRRARDSTAKVLLAAARCAGRRRSSPVVGSGCMRPGRELRAASSAFAGSAPNTRDAAAAALARRSAVPDSSPPPPTGAITTSRSAIVLERARAPRCPAPR